MSENRNVVLIGMPGVGKTTVGVLLAERLGFNFIDSDITIQIRENRRLQEIIDSDGLAAFQRVEASAILSISVSATVIATGGSVVYSAEAVGHLKAGGTICHLDAAPRCLLARIDDLNQRGIAMAPGQSLASLYAERQPLYRRYADFSVDVEHMSPGKVVKSIADILRKRFAFSV